MLIKKQQPHEKPFLPMSMIRSHARIHQYIVEVCTTISSIFVPSIDANGKLAWETRSGLTTTIEEGDNIGMGET